jgi:uncharacterized OsmC-like protein
MATSKVHYEGNLRTSCTHLHSSTKIITDAPIDNKGKGESFSPTDLVATALASCAMTIIGIYCEAHQINYVQGNAEVTKVMGTDPRRIVEIHIKFDFSRNGWDIKTQKIIQNVAETCPVAKSIHPSIELFLDYRF